MMRLRRAGAVRLDPPLPAVACDDVARDDLAPAARVEFFGWGMDSLLQHR
jgi:hypothetical protein